MPCFIEIPIINANSVDPNKMPHTDQSLHCPNMSNDTFFALRSPNLQSLSFWAQLFKTNDVLSQHIVKIFITKYGIYANIFAEKMRVAFAFAKATRIFFSKISNSL